jgi:diaminohydroxyphosphoribosylaminopyrimidine deaminase / 5-amino-6-(5-phosphoribosylamino)uracil reductase
VQNDEFYMMRCLELAKLGELDVAPNPMVGCVIVYNGKIVAEGYHEIYGSPHAEVNAFSQLSNLIPIHLCDVYVNLEPCSHYGKTPPCSDLIIAKKPKRVIIGMLDPHHKVAGKGIKKLMEAGVNVSVGTLEEDCKMLNKIFIKAHTTALPYVTLKWAETNNGFMARHKNDLSTTKISDSNNNDLVHHLRGTHQAILVGASTVNNDNPRLDARYSNGSNPVKIVLSTKLSVDLNKDLFMVGKTWVYNQLKSEVTDNYELIKLEQLSLLGILQDLAARDIQSVLVEGGPLVLDSFISQKLWDEAIIIKSSAEWTDGIKAPWLGIPSYEEIIRNNDTIKYFKPA